MARGILATLVRLFQDFARNDRVVVPLLKTLDLLFTGGSLDNQLADAECGLAMNCDFTHRSKG